MILREHYAERRTSGENGIVLILDYTATLIPETATLAALLQSAGVLFTVTTPLGTVYPLLRKESIVLEGMPGASGQITARIRYAERPEDTLSGASVISVQPAPAASAPYPVVSASPIGLPLQSHHWTLRITDPFSNPRTELRCTGLCDGQQTTENILRAGVGVAFASVATPQFGVIAGLIKEEVDLEPQGTGGAARATVVWRGQASISSDFPLAEVRYTTGTRPGTCTVTITQRGSAPSLTQNLGDPFSFEGIFQGTVCNIDRHVSAGGLYSAGLTALDARWDMAGAIIGSAPTGGGGDASASAAARGYEWVFNRGGWPDKNPGAPQFQEGNGAVFWTYGDILNLLCEAYLPATVTAPSWTDLDNAGNMPGEIDLRGRDLATAIDSLLAQMGYTWTLRYGGGTAQLYPFNTASGSISIPIGALQQNALSAVVASKSETIQDAYTSTEVLSGQAVCQCGFASQPSGSFAGLTQLITRPSQDADFAYEYRPDFSGISSLFPFVANRPVKGYPLRAELASRILEGSPASGYAAPRLSGQNTAPLLGLPLTSYFWATWDDLEGDWRRVVGGIELRLDPPSVLVRRRIAVYSAGATHLRPKVEEVRPLERSGFQIAGTLAFTSDYRLSSIATGGGSEITRQRVITQRQIVPTYAASWIGETFNPNDLNGFQVFGALTTLVDAQAQLDALASAAQAGQTAERVQSEARINYWPTTAAVGMTLAVDGSFFTGPEGIITEAVFRRAATESCVLRATNQPLSDAQRRSEPVAAARQQFMSQLSSS